MTLHTATQTAAHALTAELDSLCNWERDLAEDLARTRAKRTQLLRALMGMLDVLEPSARPALMNRLNVIQARLDPPRGGGPSSDKVAAVMDYMARAPGPVTVAEVQGYLERQGLADYASAAATLLSRKVKQGVVERMGRGRYRVL